MSNILINNYKTTLVNSLGVADTQMYVGHSLPALQPGDYYLVTLFAKYGADESNWEIVKVTAAGGSVLTISRGQEGTAARNWDNGTLVEMRLTAGQITGKTDVGHKHELSDVNGLEANLNVLQDAIAALGTAQGEISQDSNPSLVLDTTNKVLPFTVTTPSTDTDIFTLDGVANTITFNRDANYTFISSVTFESTTDLVRTVTFKLVDVATDMVIGTQTAELEIPNGDIEVIPFNTLLTVGKNGTPNSPLTIRVEATANGNGFTINQFDSVITSGGNYDMAQLVIDDTITGAAKTWSSLKISTELSSKASTAVATTSTNGLMSSTDKTKLDGVMTDLQALEVLVYAGL